MSLKARLLAAFLLIGIIPIAIVGTWSIVHFEKNFTELAFERLVNVREVKKAQIQSYFTERKHDVAAITDTIDSLMHAASEKISSVQENKRSQMRLYFDKINSDVQLFSANPVIVQAIQDFAGTVSADGSIDMKLYDFFNTVKYRGSIHQLKNAYGYRDVMLATPDGTIVYSTDPKALGRSLTNREFRDTSIGQCFKHGLIQTNFKDFGPHPLSVAHDLFSAGAPVIQDETPLGVLILLSDKTIIEQIIDQRQGMGETGLTHILGKTSGRISHRAGHHDDTLHRSHSSGLNDSAATESVPDKTETLEEIFNLSPEPALRLSYDGDMVIMRVDRLAVPGLDWALVTTMALEEALSPEYQAGKNVYFENYIRNNGYADLFILSGDGTLLYAFHPSELLGRHLGDLTHTGRGLPRLYERILESGTFRFLDFYRYTDSETPYALIGQPLMDNGNIQLIVALQLSIDPVNAIMKERKGLGETGETYLVGPDGLMRSDAVLAPDTHSFLASLAAPEQGRVTTDPARQALAGNTGELITIDYRGVPVLSAFAPIPIDDTIWGILSEIDKAEAFSARTPLYVQVGVLAGVILISLLLALYFVTRMIQPLKRLQTAAADIGAGNYDSRVPAASRDEIGSLAMSFNQMAATLEQTRISSRENDWIKQGIMELDALLRGDLSLDDFSRNLLTFVCTYVNAQVGVIHVDTGEDDYRFKAGYAFTPGTGFQETVRPGQGLPGQAVQQKKIIQLAEVPDTYIQVHSGLGHAPPRWLLILPLIYKDRVEAVMEIGFLSEPPEYHCRFLKEASANGAMVIVSTRSRDALNDALEKTARQAEELQQQQEELQSANEELEEQTQMLSASESRLKEQHEELQAANEELEEKTGYLEQTRKELEEKNRQLEEFGRNLRKKAADLAAASKYKSEFLANMSHELRTPLNSMLLLSKLTAENKEGNLTEEQIESMNIIHNSGNDLLSLINEILDLSKIEAGKMQLNLQTILVQDLKQILNQYFHGLAADKGLSFEIVIHDAVPESITSDQARVLQVLKNFISNAFKFTVNGGITVSFYTPDRNTRFEQDRLKPGAVMAIDVTDTGIGIPADKQQLIFEAFQQAEGGTTRKYGGTGLGLSISLELSRLLGGEIRVKSHENKGSTFTLFLPFEGPSTENSRLTTAEKTSDPVTVSPKKTPLFSADTSYEEVPKEPVPTDENALLIIEDDAAFAETLAKLCRDRGFDTVIALSGEKGLTRVHERAFRGIILDIHLPGISGWDVLDALKKNPATRHIPVHIMSADDPDPRALSRGAVGFITKPVTRENVETVISRMNAMAGASKKNLLLVEDNPAQRRSITELISGTDVFIVEAADGAAAMNALRQQRFDCMILDLGLPDMSGFDLLRKMNTDDRIHPPPVVVYTARDLTSEEENELAACSDSIIIKGVRSEERLLDETSLFLHRVVSEMSKEKKTMISDLHDVDQVLQGKTVLLVDDDMRNVFALSRVLVSKGLHTLKAENGLKALEILDQHEEVDLVLMDVMMPVMDGYETMKKIRAQDRFAELPVIALTAKAMQRDREDCISAGANDYLAKPVETERLLSMMRVWLSGR